MKEKVAVLEDEKDILDLISLHLEKAGFTVSKFSTADDFFKSFSRESFSLLILDLILPDMDGIDVCRQVKNNPGSSSMPVIMVTAKTELSDKVVGLEMGADDYVTKPFSPRELVARARSVLRRYSRQGGDEKIYIGNEISIDTGKRQVLVEGRIAELTFAEYGILFILASKKGWVFSREKIIDTLWDGEKAVIERTVDVHVKNLRTKLGNGKKILRTYEA